MGPRHSLSCNMCAAPLSCAAFTSIRLRSALPCQPLVILSCLSGLRTHTRHKASSVALPLEQLQIVPLKYCQKVHDAGAPRQAKSVFSALALSLGESKGALDDAPLGGITSFSGFQLSRRLSDVEEDTRPPPVCEGTSPPPDSLNCSTRNHPRCDSFEKGRQQPPRALQGSASEAPPPQDLSQVALKVHTINANSLGTLKGLLESPSAHIVLAQEHRLAAKDDIEQASSWCLRRGWRSIWAPANITPAKDTSGGVAIFVRSWIGLMELPDGISSSGRCLCCEAHLPGTPLPVGLGLPGPL